MGKLKTFWEIKKLLIFNFKIISGIRKKVNDRKIMEHFEKDFWRNIKKKFKNFVSKNKTWENFGEIRQKRFVTLKKFGRTVIKLKEIWTK